MRGLLGFVLFRLWLAVYGVGDQWLAAFHWPLVLSLIAAYRSSDCRRVGSTLNRVSFRGCLGGRWLAFEFSAEPFWELWIGSRVTEFRLQCCLFFFRRRRVRPSLATYGARVCVDLPILSLRIWSRIDWILRFLFMSDGMGDTVRWKPKNHCQPLAALVMEISSYWIGTSRPLKFVSLLLFFFWGLVFLLFCFTFWGVWRSRWVWLSISPSSSKFDSCSSSLLVLPSFTRFYKVVLGLMRLTFFPCSTCSFDSAFSKRRPWKNGIIRIWFKFDRISMIAIELNWALLGSIPLTVISIELTFQWIWNYSIWLGWVFFLKGYLMRVK